LLHLDRCRLVLEDSFISKIELCTGPQAVTGSTRMQATTIETFVIGIIFEEAIKANVDKDFQLKANIEILQKLII
jgi:N-acetylmuramic acid 6-phosphate etherase